MTDQAHLPMRPMRKLATPSSLLSFEWKKNCEDGFHGRTWKISSDTNRFKDGDIADIVKVSDIGVVLWFLYE